AESTLAAPAIVGPPPQPDPGIHSSEYRLFRDGVRTGGTGLPGAIPLGFGLRNPDDDGPNGPDPLRPSLKPKMTVVYQPANDMLHAFRAGPCGTGTCAETGGEELWGFVPYDELGKLSLAVDAQAPGDHQYMIATSVRMADVFVPGPFSRNVGGVTVTGSGV